MAAALHMKVCFLLLMMAGVVLLGSCGDPQPRSSNQNTHLSTAVAEYRKTNRYYSGPQLAGLAAEEETESRENPDGRAEWFYGQRSYPDGLKVNARMLAWNSMRLKSQALSVSAESWSSIGPSPTRSAFEANWGHTSGRINAIAISPSNSQVILLGTATGGIWRSSDAGETFVPVSDNSPDLAVGSIAFSRSEPSIVYAGMGDSAGGYLGTGVLRSTNAGRSWTRVSNSSLPSLVTVSKVEVDPVDSNRVYVAQSITRGGGSGGIYISTNGGVSWTRTIAGRARDLIIDPSDRRILFAGFTRVDGITTLHPGVLRSTDSGLTWSNSFISPFDTGRTRDIRISSSSASPDTVFTYIGGISADIDLRVLVSTDRGDSWQQRSSANIDPGQFGYNTFLACHPSRPNHLYIGARDLYSSTDGGISWRNATRGFTETSFGWLFTPGSSTTHVDQHAIAWPTNQPDTIYLGNDGGVSRSTNSGATFRSLNSTLTLSQFTGIALHPQDSAITYGGTQDNGTQRRLADSNDWLEFASGDGGHPVIDRLDPQTVYATYIRGTIFRFTANGQLYDGQVGSNTSFDEAVEGARIAFYPPFVGNSVDSTLYFGTWRLFISTDRGNSWVDPGNNLDLTRGFTAAGVDVLTAIGVSKSDKQVVYTGSSQGRAMMSTDAGISWTDVSAGLPDRFITDIEVDKNDPSTVYLTVSGFGSAHVFKRTGESQWTSASQGLPDVPANALLIDPNDSSLIYAGTDIGVFRSTSSGESWEPFNEGLPPVIVTDIAAQESGLIQIATYGRGAYEVRTAGAPHINAVELRGKKLIITGTSLGPDARIFINGIDKTPFRKSSTEKKIKLKGSEQDFGLVPGENRIQVRVGARSSNPFLIQR